jgi:ABC-2 type transport system permease protein
MLIGRRSAEARQPLGEGLRPPFSSRGVLDLWPYRDVLATQIARDFRTRYQGTVLGVFWAYAEPLTRFMVYFLVIGLVLGISKSVENFPIYIFSAILVVGIFTSSVNMSTRTMASHAGAIRSTAVPHEVFAASAVGVAVANAGPALLILLLAATATGWSPVPSALLLAAAGVLLLTAFCFGIALIFSVGAVFLRDVSQLAGIISMVSFWATPVIYPVQLVEEAFGDGFLYELYLANPVTVAAAAMRRAFWEPTVTDGLPPLPSALPIVMSISLTLLVLVVGQLLQRRLSPRLYQRMKWQP